jgi:hypothetical protein
MSRRKTQHIKDTNVLIEFRRIGEKLMEQAAKTPSATASPTPSAPQSVPKVDGNKKDAPKLDKSQVKNLPACSSLDSSKYPGFKKGFEQDDSVIYTVNDKPICKDLQTKKS